MKIIDTTTNTTVPATTNTEKTPVTTTPAKLTPAEKAAQMIAAANAKKAAQPARPAPTTLGGTGARPSTTKPVTVRVIPPARQKLDPEVLRQQNLLERLNACPAISDEAQALLDGYLALGAEERVAFDKRAKASLAFLPKEQRYVGAPDFLYPGARIRFNDQCEKPTLRGKTGTVRKVGRQNVVCDVDGMRTEGYVLITSLSPEFEEEEVEETTDEVVEVESTEASAGSSDEVTAEATDTETLADLTAAVAEHEAEEAPAATGTDNELQRHSTGASTRFNGHSREGVPFGPLKAVPLVHCWRRQENMQNPRVIYLYEAFTAAIIGAIAYEVQPDGSAVKVALSSIAPEDRKGTWIDLPPFTEGPGAGKPRRKRVFSKRRTAEVALAKLPDSKVFVPILKGATLPETNLAVLQHLAFLKANVDAALASKKKYAGRQGDAGWDVYLAIDNRYQQIRLKLAEQHERATVDTSTLLTSWNLSCRSSSSSLQLVSASSSLQGPSCSWASG